MKSVPSAMKDGKLSLPKQVGGWKTRGNYAIGVCLECCECYQCRKKKERANVGRESN